MSEHVAILVVHGIGEERPYGTLDQFTRGLLKELDLDHPRTWTVTRYMETEPDPTWPGHDYPRVALRIAPRPGTTVAYKSDRAANYEDITLFEYYWSPITKNKIKYTTSLLFLIKAGLQPFKYLAANTAAISTASAGHKSSHAADRGL